MRVTLGLFALSQRYVCLLRLGPMGTLPAHQYAKRCWRTSRRSMRWHCKDNSTRPKYPSTHWLTCGTSTACCIQVVPWGGAAGRC